MYAVSKPANDRYNHHRLAKAIFWFWRLKTPSCGWNVPFCVQCSKLSSASPYFIDWLSALLCHFPFIPVQSASVRYGYYETLLLNTIAEHHQTHHHSSRENVYALTDTLTSLGVVVLALSFFHSRHSIYHACTQQPHCTQRPLFVSHGRGHTRNVGPLKRLPCLWHMGFTNTHRLTRMRTYTHSYNKCRPASQPATQPLLIKTTR